MRERERESERKRERERERIRAFDGMPRTTGHSRIRETNRRPAGKREKKRKGSEIREDVDVAEIKGEWISRIVSVRGEIRFEEG